VSYTSRTNNYKLPYVTDGEVISPSEDLIFAKTTDNQLFASMKFLKKAVIQEGTYSYTLEADGTYTVSLSPQDGVSIEAVLNEKYVFSEQVISWGRLSPNRISFLYIRYSSQISFDPSLFRKTSSVFPDVASNKKTICLAIFDPSTTTIVTTDIAGKIYAGDYFNILRTQVSLTAGVEETAGRIPVWGTNNELLDGLDLVTTVDDALTAVDTELVTERAFLTRLASVISLDIVSLSGSISDTQVRVPVWVTTGEGKVSEGLPVLDVVSPAPYNTDKLLTRNAYLDFRLETENSLITELSYGTTTLDLSIIKGKNVVVDSAAAVELTMPLAAGLTSADEGSYFYVLKRGVGAVILIAGADTQISTSMSTIENVSTERYATIKLVLNKVDDLGKAWWAIATSDGSWNEGLLPDQVVVSGEPVVSGGDIVIAS